MNLVKSSLFTASIVFIYLSVIVVTGCSGYDTPESANSVASSSLKASDFYDSGEGNSLSENGSLFDFQIQDGQPILSTSSTLSNIHSHLVNGLQYSSFVFSGSLLMTDADSGIGLTFLSQYPNQDAYYRVRRYQGTPGFHLSQHGNVTCNSKAMGLTPQANVWYSFEITTDVSASQTSFSVKMWPKGQSSQNAVKVDCVDSSAERFVAGTIGVWSMGPGSKYWTDFKLVYNPLEEEVVVEDNVPGGNTGSDPVEEPPVVEDPVVETPVEEDPVVEVPPVIEEPVDDVPSDTPEPTTPGNKVSVSTPQQLTSALSAAKAGDVIELAPGSYGALNLDNKSFSGFVTIQSRDSNNKAQFQSIEMKNAKNIRFQRIHVNYPTNGIASKGIFNVSASSYIELLNSEVNGSVQNPRNLSKPEDYTVVSGRFAAGYGIQFRDSSSNIVVQNNYIHDVETGAVFLGVSNAKVSSNTFNYLGGDNMKFAGVTNSEISYNVAAKIVVTESDMHLDFIQFQGSSSGILLKGNIHLSGIDYRNGVYQGLFIKDGTYNDFKITDNLIYTNTVNAIFVQSHSGTTPTGDNILIERNTVLSPPDITKWNKADIRLVQLGGKNYTIRNNVIDRVVDSVGGGTVSNNKTLQFTDSSKSNYYDKVYTKATSGKNAVLSDFRPLATGGAYYGSGMGAERTIKMLLKD